MATAKQLTKTVTEPVLTTRTVEKPDGIQLTLTQEEAQKLRSVLGTSGPLDIERAGLRGIKDAINPYTESAPFGDYLIVPKSKRY